MARFHDIRDRAIAKVDAMMAEQVRSFPLRNGLVDPGRQQAVFAAVVRTGNAKSESMQGGAMQSWGQRITANEAEAHVARAGQVLPWFREGDKLRLIERPGQPFVEILRINDRQHGRIVLHLGAV